MGASAAVHPADPILQAYGMGKLDDVSSAYVSRHLEACDSCQRRVAELLSDDFPGRLQQSQVKPKKASSVWSPSAVSSTDGMPGTVVPPLPVDTLPPELVDHPDWEIIRELGRGGMGVVYLARNKLMGRDEVLKVVGRHLIERPGVLDRFLREIQSAARLQHVNIVTAYSAMRVGPSLVLTMEYVKGLDLAKIVKAKGPLPIAHACSFIHQAAAGLQHAHERGMVHRDIKPANLMVGEGKKALVKLLDFGLAKVTSESQTDSGLTREGQMVGTPDYIAPEQIRDAKSADIRADIYSLGCTLYYLLTGGPPFRGEHLWDIYQAHFSTDARPLNLVRPEVPAELAAVVAKMMSKKPGRRFQTPGEVARALAPFFKLAVKPPAAASVQAPRPEPRVAAIQISSATPGPTSPATTATDNDQAVLRPPQTGTEEVAWARLIATNGNDSLAEAAKPKRTEPPLAPARVQVRRPPTELLQIMGAASAVGAMILGIIVTIKTKNAETMISTSDDRAVKLKQEGVTVEIKPSRSGDVTPRLSGTAVRREAVRNKPAQAQSELDVPPSMRGDVAARDSANVFRPQFNGRDKLGWKIHPSQPDRWRVENGVLIGSGIGFSHLYSERGDYRDFHLRVEVRINDGGNSGVFFRVPFGRGWARSYEAQIGRSRIGELAAYGSRVPGFIESHIPDREWRTLEVIADGNRLSTIVEGRTVAKFVDENPRFGDGHIALEIPDNHPTVVEFRRIEIIELHRTRAGESSPGGSVATRGPGSGIQEGHSRDDGAVRE